MQKFLTPVVLASLFIGQGYPALYAQQPAQQPTQLVARAPSPNPIDTPRAESSEVLLPEGTDVSLLFDEDLSSKTATQDDEVTFILAEDLKVGNIVVAKEGSKARGEVTNAQRAGMMGKAGQLNIRLTYLKVGNFKVKLRGVKGKEGESGTTGAIVLTVLFGPIGLIKHGKDININKGTALKAYVADDINLPPVM